jgi:hypothetical protein
MRLFEKSNLLLTLRLEVADIGDFTHLRGLKNLNFLLVHGGEFSLCTSEFYSPNTFQISS